MVFRFKSLAFLAMVSISVICQAQPVSVWKCDAVGSLFVADEMGAYPGTLGGLAQIVEGGISGGCLHLTQATGDYVTMGSAFPGFATGDYTTVVWVRTLGTGDVFPVAKHESGTTAGYLTLIGTSAGGAYGADGKACTYNGGSPGNSPVSITSVNDGTWHQIVSSRYGSDGQVFVDGALEDTRPAATPREIGAPFMFGAINVGGAPWPSMTGDIDEVQVYPYALAPSEVAFLYSHPEKVFKRASLDSLILRLGRLTSGNLESLEAIDGDSLVVCKFIVPSQQAFPVTFEVKGIVSTVTPSFLRFTVRSRMLASGQFEQELVMYDYVSNGWDKTDLTTGPLGTTTKDMEVVGTGNLSRYVHPSGLTWARVRVHQTGPSAITQWCSEFDRAGWYYAP